MLLWSDDLGVIFQLNPGFLLKKISPNCVNFQGIEWDGVHAGEVQCSMDKIDEVAKTSHSSKDSGCCIVDSIKLI